MTLTPRQRQVWVLLAAALLIAVVWWVQNGAAETGQDQASQNQASQNSSAPSRTDPDSGLPMVQVGNLPPEAAETIDRIHAGGPLYHRDGVTFENREGLLPDHPRGYYQEYTVPTPGSDGRGARRIVVGDEGEFYWTGDHYRTFSRIER